MSALPAKADIATLGDVCFGKKSRRRPIPGVFSDAGLGLVTPMSGAITAYPHFTDDIVRVGLNYQFHRSVDQSGERD
jgi:hypothetical protein